MLGPTATATSTLTATLQSLIPIFQPTATPRSAELLILGDIWVLGMEITQAIQVYPGNPIPLIGVKPTVVRVYVQSLEGGAGPWTDVTARLTVTGGGTRGIVLLPSTTSPSATITVPTGGSNRSILADSFNFLLPPEYAVPGERSFQVNIYSIRGRLESSTTNNAGSLRIAFKPGVYRTIYVVPYGNDGSDPANPRLAPAPWTDVEPHRRYTENVFPVTQFFTVPFPGVGEGGRYFRDLNAARAWADMLLGRSEYSTARICLLQPEDTCGCGYASGRRMNGQNSRSAFQPGAIMAQEVAHSYGEWWHAVSIPDHDADLPRAEFPYGHTSIGNQVGISTRVITSAGFFTIQTVPPVQSGGHTHDFMGYGGPPIWVSPYSYCALIDRFSGGTYDCPAAARRALGPTPEIVRAGFRPLGLADLAAQQENTYLYISGYLNPDGSASFEPFFQQASVDDLTNLPEGKRYSVRFEDGSGGVLVEYNFEPLVSHPEPDQPLLFSLTVPYNASTARITLWDGIQQLAERLVSANAPQVTLLSPTGGGGFSGRQTVSWDASDADGDALMYLVEYSPDGGETWLGLDARLTETSTEIDFTSVPGSSEAILRVVASDGVNTSEARSDSALDVPLHSPEAVIFLPTEGASFYTTHPFYAQATAFDWEDGPLADDAGYVWSSDVDGELGSGPWVVLAAMTPGEHTLTLTATDSDGNTTQASVQVTILAAESPDEPPPAEESAVQFGETFRLGLIAAGAVLVILVLLVAWRATRQAR